MARHIQIGVWLTLVLTQVCQGKFWEDLDKKRRELYNSKLEQVRQTAEAILGPGVAPSPEPSPEEDDDFFAWAKQAAAWAPRETAPENGEEAQPEPDEPELEERGWETLEDLGRTGRTSKHGLGASPKKPADK